MNVPVLNRLPSLGIGGNNRKSRTRLNKRQRESFRDTQKLWLDMALRIINTSQPSVATVIGVTSSIEGEGKTTNCIGIGSAISKETDEKVLMIECDLIRPSLASYLGLTPRPGVIDTIKGDVSIDKLVQHTPFPNFDIIVAGGEESQEDALDDILDQPLLSVLRRKLDVLLAPFKREYGFIMLDMPPLLNSPYTRDLVKYTDGTFLAVKGGSTPSDSLTHASDLIGEDKLLGVILIGSDSPLPNWLIRILGG